MEEEDHEGISETEDEKVKENIVKNKIRREKGEYVVKYSRARALTMELDKDNLDHKSDYEHEQIKVDNMQDADNPISHSLSMKSSNYHRRVTSPRTKGRSTVNELAIANKSRKVKECDLDIYNETRSKLSQNQF